MSVKRGVAYLAYAREIFQGEAELGEHFFVRNGFVILEPFPGPFDSAHLFLADRFAINGSVGETAGHRIADRLKSVETTFECGFDSFRAHHLFSHLPGLIF